MSDVFKGLDRGGKPKKIYLKKPQSVSLETLECWPSNIWKSVIVEEKLDGLRAFYFRGKLYSNNLKPFYNVDPIIKQIEKGFGRHKVVDGELNGQSWEEVMSVVRSSKTRKDLGNVKFCLFDLLREEEFLLGVESYMSLHNRLHFVNKFVQESHKHFESPLINRVKQYQVKSFAQFEKVLTSIIESGKEGLMIKNLHAPYDFWRNKSWLRIKIDNTEDVTVVGFEEGKGKYKGMLGSLECMDDNGQKCNVSGFTDTQRVSIWHNQSHWLNKKIEVKYLKKTEQGNLFSPRFKRVRWDKK